MGMRETPRSIRAYFLFSGVMAALAAFAASSALLANAAYSTVNVIAVVSIVAYAGELLLIGIRFPTLLRERPKRLEQGVYTVLAFGAMNAFTTYASVSPAILLVNVRRLAREAAASPPTA